MLRHVLAVLYMLFVGCLISAGLCGARVPAVRVLHAGGERPQPGPGGTDPRPGPRHHHHHHCLSKQTCSTVTTTTTTFAAIWLPSLWRPIPDIVDAVTMGTAVTTALLTVVSTKNQASAPHNTWRSHPLMSVFIPDGIGHRCCCILAEGTIVAASLLRAPSLLHPC